METKLKTEMLFQATFVNMLILKAHFHLFWMHASMNCTHVSGLANHFIFGIGSINILCIFTDDYDNLFYQILPRNCEIFGNWTSLRDYHIFKHISMFSVYYQIYLEKTGFALKVHTIVN